VAELVQHRDSDLVAQLLGVGKGRLERNPVDRNLVGEHADVVAALWQRHAVVEAEEVGIVRVLVLDDDRDVAERAGDLGREVVESGLDQLFKRQLQSGNVTLLTNLRS
jgi:hypothetical protein